MSGFWKINTTESAALAADRAALKALDTTKNKAATLVEGGGTFRRSNDDNQT